MRDRRTVVLAGAGCSTESGIPDYRGPEGRLHKRAPVQYGDFVRSESNRKRYWARSTIGWSRVSDASPNPAHTGLARLEERGEVIGIITQNVDGLHHAGGSRRVIELHGSLSSVVCLDCGDRGSRDAFQERLVGANAEWLSGLAENGTTRVAPSAPDGDAELSEGVYDDFAVPSCHLCDGVVKPDVVFFGENVPKNRVEQCWALLEEADMLLVVGSSLTVYSGRRFIYRANERGMPIGIVNLGPTRADDYAEVKVEGRVGEVIPRLAQGLM